MSRPPRARLRLIGPDRRRISRLQSSRDRSRLRSHARSCALSLIQDRVAYPRFAPRAPLFATPGSPPVEWIVSSGLTGYDEALAEMEARDEGVTRGFVIERVWRLEHPPLHTAATRPTVRDLLDP